MIEQGPTQIIKIHYPDQYPFSPENLGPSELWRDASVCRSAPLISTLASSIKQAEESAKQPQPEGRAVASISRHGNKWKGVEAVDG